MWELRILSGPQAGSIMSLKMGRNLIGRAPNCDIKIQSSGASKEHAEIHVYKEKILIVDLRSSNGTYLNGIKVQNGIIRLGDKLGIHDVILDIVPAPEARANAPVVAPSQQVYQAEPMSIPQPPPSIPQSIPASTGPIAQSIPYQQVSPLKGILVKAEDYLEQVALPGVYKLAKMFEFRYVLGLFILIFIFSVTLLSMIPMVQITRASITKESMRRAQSLARSLAQVNQQALLQGALSNLSTHSIETEDGVKRAFIIHDMDGVILAPSSQAGNSPDLPFVVSARREKKSIAVEVDSSTIGASFPIGMYDPNTGEPIVKAHAVVLYDVGSLAFDDGRALSLFMQTLVIAALLGGILFFFMYKLIEYPIVQLNSQLDIALREKKDNIHVDFIFPALQALVGNTNSLLTRYLHGEGENSQSAHSASGLRDTEASNILLLMGYPAVAVRADRSIVTCNPAFEQFARNTQGALQGQSISSIRDDSLRQNMEFLLEKATELPGLTHRDQLEFSGHPCILSCQAIMGAEAVEYYILSISPADGGPT